MRAGRLAAPAAASCRALLWPLCLPLAAALAMSTTWSFAPPVLESGVVAVGLVVLGTWTVAMASRVVARLWRRAWRGTAATGLALLAVWPFVAAALVSGDYIHLTLMYPIYAARIGNVQPPPRCSVSFDWGGSGGRERSLVYDACGVMWYDVGVARSPVEPALSAATTHLIGRFYIVELIRS